MPANVIWYFCLLESGLSFSVAEYFKETDGLKTKFTRSFFLKDVCIQFWERVRANHATHTTRAQLDAESNKLIHDQSKKTSDSVA